MTHGRGDGVTRPVSMTMPMLDLARRLHAAGMSFKGCAIACEVIYGQSPSPYTFRNHLTGTGRFKGAGVSKDLRENLSGQSKPATPAHSSSLAAHKPPAQT